MMNRKRNKIIGNAVLDRTVVCRRLLGTALSCRVLFGMILLGMVLPIGVLGGCGVPDKALVFAVEDTEAEKSETEMSAAEKSETEKSAAESTSMGVAAENGDMTEETLIFVHVCGAVAEPGVVELPEGSRAAAALAEAGGLTAEAHPDYVNLAAVVEDGQRLYFPTRLEADILMQEEQAAASGLVNINTASAEQLCTLPGIGEARAEAIIGYRETNGGFQSVEDIMKVSGIKESAFVKLQDKITVD